MALSIKVGADPEFFLRQNNHWVSAHTLELGTKTAPYRTRHGHLQMDGIALECNVTPASTRDEFVKNVRGVMEDMQLEVDLRSSEGTFIVAKPSIFFGRKKLAQLPQWAGELGCRPDYNAWTGQQNPTPPANLHIRTGSGHVHVSWTADKLLTDPDHLAKCSQLACQLDYALGLPSLLWDDDKKRRLLYGQAGTFRPKPYGMEYRVLSNKWTESDELIGWVFDATVRTTRDLFENGVYYPSMWGRIARDYIDRSDPSWVKVMPKLQQELLR